MRVLATVVLAAFLGVFACAGQAHVSEQHLCCGSQAAVSEWNPCECCQLSLPVAPALLRAKAPALLLPALPASTFSLADSVAARAAGLLIHPFAESSDPSPPKLYLLNATLLI